MARLHDPVDRFTAAYGIAFAALVGVVGRDARVLAEVAVGNALLGWVALRLTPALRAARAWPVAYLGAVVPPLVFFVFYRESMAVLGSPTLAFHDAALIAVERNATAAIPTLPWRWAGEWFAFAYMAYVPMLLVATVALFAAEARGAAAPVSRTLRCVCYVWAACFTAYLLFPILGPRFLDPALHAARLGPGPFSRLAVANQRLMLRGGAFPSAHVAATTVAFLGLWSWRRRLFWALLPIGASLALGAVYLGYHYVADVIAGGGLAVCAFVLDARRCAARAPIASPDA